MADSPAPRTPHDLRCSFCEQRPDDPHHLVLGPTPAVGMPPVAICHDCVALCNEIIAEQTHPAAGPPPAAA
ncbi:MAG TPA: ClpX C4-type zinc finger protein [Solirubrobacteraceae bacterium]|nr:ClpX C4-type zinc finger protein [Solirubrobacteraceae bacterium]